MSQSFHRAFTHETLRNHVVLNPVRAKMLRSMRDWPWSSYRATAGQTEVPELLTVDWVLSQFHRVTADTDSPRVAGNDRNSQGTQATAVFPAYRRFIRQGRGINVWEELRAGALLGTDGFVDQLRPLLKEKPLDPEYRKRQRFAARPSLEELFRDVTDKATRNERIYQAVLWLFACANSFAVAQQLL